MTGETATQYSYYSTNEEEEIRRAKRLKEIRRKTYEILKRMPAPRYLIIFSMILSKEDWQKLYDSIFWMKDRGLSALNYLPLLERAIEILLEDYKDDSLSSHGLDLHDRIKNLSNRQKLELGERILKQFYLPIIRMRRIYQVRILSGDGSLNVPLIKTVAQKNGAELRLMASLNEFS